MFHVISIPLALTLHGKHFCVKELSVEISAYGKMQTGIYYSMKKLSQIALGSASLLLLVVATTTVTRAASDPKPAASGSTFAERVEQRKQEQSIVLTDTDQKRLISTCQNAQGKITQAQPAVPATLASYTKVYGQINAKLYVAIGQLQLASEDTFNLEKQRLAFVDKLTDFQTIAANYTQTLDDLVVINCQADPIGFKALLETARTYYKQLIAKAAENRDYVVNTIKPTLANHTADLQAKTQSRGGN